MEWATDENGLTGEERVKSGCWLVASTAVFAWHEQVGDGIIRLESQLSNPASKVLLYLEGGSHFYEH